MTLANAFPRNHSSQAGQNGWSNRWRESAPSKAEIAGGQQTGNNDKNEKIAQGIKTCGILQKELKQQRRQIGLKGIVGIRGQKKPEGIARRQPRTNEWVAAPEGKATICFVVLRGVWKAGRRRDTRMGKPSPARGKLHAGTRCSRQLRKPGNTPGHDCGKKKSGRRGPDGDLVQPRTLPSVVLPDCIKAKRLLFTL